MSDYCYLSFSLKLKTRPSEEIFAAFIKGAVLNSLTTVFGEIGGHTELDLLAFDKDKREGIFRVPRSFAVKTRAALTLINQFQGVPAIFQFNPFNMSYCKTYGKDKVMFVTKEDHAEKSKIELAESEPQPGLLLPSGEINWNCPCLGGMATGPCGVEFREAFSCFHYSEAEPKGSDCYDAFKTMQDCMSQYPTVYNQNSGDDEKNALGMDLGLDDDDDDEEDPMVPEHSHVAEDGKNQRELVKSK